MSKESTLNLFRRLEQLNGIGAALSRERDIDRLLENILEAAKTITGADGGTLYSVTEDQSALKFEILRTDSLGINLGGTTGKPIDLPLLPLRTADGGPNDSLVAAHAAIHDRTVNIADAYSAAGFDFSGTRAFDQRTGYRSQSFLTVPMKNHDLELIGVLQLINARDPDTGEVITFSQADQSLAESLASQAAIALTNRLLITQLERLFESFVNLINLAIDEKSPYTGGHCQRVPALTMMLAEAVDATREGPLAAFKMSDRDRYELKMAGLLHDCGKITTPVHVVDKATKLQTIYDRIGLVDTRFEVLKRDAELAALRRQLALRPVVDARAEGQELQALQHEIHALEEDRHRGHAPRRPAARARHRRHAPLAQPAGCADELFDGGGGGEPHHPLRHAEPGRARHHQLPHRRHHQDAGDAALAAPPPERARIRWGPPRTHGRQGLSAWPHAPADVAAGPHDGHCRHL